MRCAIRDWRASACALAVLLGLLAMHGLPFGAAGCQAGAVTTVSMPATDMPAAESGPPAGGAAGALALAVAGWAGAGSGRRPAPADHPPWRSGELLTRMCVSRT